jgi:hypothetical protein
VRSGPATTIARSQANATERHKVLVDVAAPCGSNVIRATLDTESTRLGAAPVPPDDGHPHHVAGAPRAKSDIVRRYAVHSWIMAGLVGAESDRPRSYQTSFAVDSNAYIKQCFS